MELPDIQKTPDERGVYINSAGITDFRLPILLKIKDSEELCNTVANVSCFVDLDKEVKGINMSRLPIFLHNNRQISLTILNEYCKEITEISNSTSCQLVYDFLYFMNKKAPVSNIEGIVNYSVKFYDTYFKPLDSYKQQIEITAIVSTCCPCSKEISDYNAHNQKCYITLNVSPIDISKIVWIEDLVDIAEHSGSCPIYSVLKRPDEKYVTEKMYDNPRFVEDVVRECYLKLNELDNIKINTIKAVADESIHMHKAMASITLRPPLHF